MSRPVTTVKKYTVWRLRGKDQEGGQGILEWKWYDANESCLHRCTRQTKMEEIWLAQINLQNEHEMVGWRQIIFI